tara:strand:- start:1380 stop:2222 length:843 start_codon:yes stop_codon:yes gene_type:complete
MNLRSLIVIGLIFLGLAPASAQYKVLDKPWVKENTPTRRVVPYTHVREADVMWNRRVWRTIDLREKINQPLYFPTKPIAGRKSLFEIIKLGIEEGTLTAYDKDYDEFTVPLTKAEVSKGILTTFELKKNYDEYGDEIEGSADTTWVDIESDAISAYRLKEEWFFDRERSKMDVRILGICPVKLLFNEDATVRGNDPMFWIYYPEARYVFANYDVFNRQNDAERRTFEDIFWKRMFNSYAYKKSNVYDRQSYSFLKNIDILLEADKIKNELFIMEHDLWSY